MNFQTKSLLFKRDSISMSKMSKFHDFISLEMDIVCIGGLNMISDVFPSFCATLGFVIS